MDDSALLDLVDEAIAAILGGGAPRRWQEGSHVVEHMSLGELMAFKTQLENRIAAADSGLFLPVRNVDL